MKVFLCGPGIDSSSYKVRETIKTELTRIPNVSVFYGEEITSHTVRVGRTNLQTIEAKFATQTDFTILILNSPGAFAELGTFTMIPDIRARLFVFVPSQYYGSRSYIARGPLSLLAESHVQNISYFDMEVSPSSISELFFPVSLAKYARQLGGPEYDQIVLAPSRKQSQYAYERFISEYREQYSEVVCYMSILTNGKPSFIELVRIAKLPPKTITKSLSRLFRGGKIIKNKLGRYQATSSR